MRDIGNHVIGHAYVIFVSSQVLCPPPPTPVQMVAHTKYMAGSCRTYPFPGEFTQHVSRCSMTIVSGHRGDDKP